MEFKRYNDIENSYRSKTINEIYDLGYDKQEWVVTEKVHGSNCAFYLNHEGIRFAKRSLRENGDGCICGPCFWSWRFSPQLDQVRAQSRGWSIPVYPCVTIC